MAESSGASPRYSLCPNSHAVRKDSSSVGIDRSRLREPFGLPLEVRLGSCVWIGLGVWFGRLRVALGATVFFRADGRTAANAFARLRVVTGMVVKAESKSDSS